MTELYQITSGYFCAGIEVKGDTVVKAAPILRRNVGHSFATFLNYCDYKGWEVHRVGN